MPVFTSPDVRNLSVGTGFIEFKPEGASSYYHVGNVPNFTFQISTKTLDHYVPVNGMRIKDYTWTLELTADIAMDMEEITAQNLAMIMLGNIGTDGSGRTQVGISAQPPRSGALRYTATNETGPRWLIDLYSVTFNGNNTFDPLTGGSNFDKLSVTGSAMAVNGSFGVMTLI
jgi:hypothetical protein